LVGSFFIISSPHGFDKNSPAGETMGTDLLVLSYHQVRPHGFLSQFITGRVKKIIILRHGMLSFFAKHLIRRLPGLRSAPVDPEQASLKGKVRAYRYSQ